VDLTEEDVRKFIDAWYRLLTWLLVGTVVLLIVPVTLQILSRVPGELIARYIWTEELARFLFIWMVMLGAMVAIRDGTHFDVDVWPELRPGPNAMLRIVSSIFVLILALAFVWWGVQFTSFGWNQTSEIADLPMWLIFIAWPITGLTWLLFLGESFARDFRIVVKREKA
jgi:TRAP-type C4-dicarboxylate transport system permease small subunit